MIYAKEQKNESTYASVNTLGGSSKSISTEFRYIVQQGDGYWTLARYIMDNSGRPYIIQQTINNKLVGEIADAIMADLAKKGITILKPGDVLILQDVGYYVPRLSINGNVKEDKSTTPENIAKDTTTEKTNLSQSEGETELVIIQKIYPKIEHGKLEKVNAIVIHQTDTTSEEQVFNSYSKGPDGAHFLIDKKGNIYQTARLEQSCYHVGLLKSKVAITQEGKDLESVNQIWESDKLTFNQKIKKLNDYEREKKYPDRYPYNADSIGIEIVGKANDNNTGNKIYENLTKEQQEALSKLLTYLFSKFSLSKSDVYRHPEVSYKNETEAESATW
ncbi:MAG TPA: peptidoglycan recognition family protein [Bacillota bacterium]|nr:peptidoglycan recognition family protein [Bacillota bacterium]